MENFIYVKAIRDQAGTLVAKRCSNLILLLMSFIRDLQEWYPQGVRTLGIPLSTHKEETILTSGSLY